VWRRVLLYPGGAGSDPLVTVVLRKACRFLYGDLLLCGGDQVPPGLPDQIAPLIAYRPEDEGLSEREVYDYLANSLRGKAA
jgi:hypothetical protein